MASQKAYYAIQNSLKPVEKALINFYELQWALNHTVPTVEEVFAHLRKGRENLRLTSVNYFLTRQPVIKALEVRGIPWRQHSRDELTSQQQAAALTVMNFADERSISEKLDQLGILPATYYAWLNDPQFKNLLESLAEQNKLNIRPAAVTEFTKKVHQGDWNAIKFWLEVTGEFSQSDLPRSDILLMRFVEVIQKHVKNPEVIKAIAMDLKLAAANRTLEVVVEQPALEGELATGYDEELESAKKQLGYG